MTAEQDTSRYLGSVITDREQPTEGGDTTGFTTVVTGLPRSGTSLMMQMLVAGGLPALTDEERPADDDNPKGYLEFERVKNLRADSSWFSEARGKAVKVIAQLLQHIPLEGCRVVYMDRDIDEVLRSQGAMLERSGRAGASLGSEQLTGVFRKQIQAVQGLLEQNGTPVLKVLYSDCIGSPAGVASAVNSFLGGSLDEGRMASAVDGSLYRQRSAGAPQPE